MEKIAAYQAAILDLLQECHETFPPTDGIENQLIIDRGLLRHCVPKPKPRS